MTNNGSWDSTARSYSVTHCYKNDSNAKFNIILQPASLHHPQKNGHHELHKNASNPILLPHPVRAIHLHERPSLRTSPTLPQINRMATLSRSPHVRRNQRLPNWQRGRRRINRQELETPHHSCASIRPVRWSGKPISPSNDALLRVEMKMQSIVVSDHGGREVDGAVISLAVLSNIVKPIGREARCPVRYRDPMWR